MPPPALLTLFAEPHHETLLMYREYFVSAGVEVDEAEEGRQALAKPLDHPHDGFVTETRMPGLDGFALCGLLREDAATRTTPIVVLTADAYARSIERATRAGADCVLVKPCLPDVLLREVQRLNLVMRQSKELRGRATAL